MATISLPEGDALRAQFRASVLAQNHTKPCIRAVAQAIEDFMMAQAATIGSTIDTAAAPFSETFSNAEKKAIFAAWAAYKFNKDK